MDKAAFEPHNVYTVTLLDDLGRPHPATFYVLRSHEPYMIARSTADGNLHRIPYERIERVVASRPVPPERQIRVPAALLEEVVWRDRVEMQTYASGSHTGH